MSGNILFDGEFIRTGIYTMKSGKGPSKCTSREMIRSI